MRLSFFVTHNNRSVIRAGVSLNIHSFTLKKEAFAIMLAPKHFDIYVKANDPVAMVYRDNNPLTCIPRAKQTKQIIMTWSLMIQGYCLQIKHLPGTLNSFADSSRAPSDD